MKKNNIFILSGPIQSGKTTRLIKWLEERDNIHGILTPVIDGKRIFMNAATKEIFPMEAEEGESNVLTAGRYTFSKPAFDRAKNILLDGFDQKNICLIIDEIGLLELKSAGFSDVLKKILSDISIDNSQSKKQKLILVIRKSLLKEVLIHFEIKSHQQFTEDLQCGERGIRTPG
ncbi:MAG: nucleoside-triphosphatase [Chitinophagales bacterium]